MGNPEVFLFGACSAVLKYFTHYMGEGQRPRSAKQVGTVKAITLYPGKSMSGIGLQECECTFAGLTAQGVRDR